MIYRLSGCGDCMPVLASIPHRLPITITDYHMGARFRAKPSFLPTFMTHFSFLRRFPAFAFPVVLGCCLFALGGCSSVPRVITEYRIDVQQGNLLTQEQVSQLRPGLTHDQVRYVLGTPLLVDIFHGDERWDYVYRLKKGATGEIESRRLTLFFDRQGTLERVTGDVVPEEGSVSQSTAPEKPGGENSEKREKTDDQAAVPQEETDGDDAAQEAAEEEEQVAAAPATSSAEATGSTAPDTSVAPEEAAQASKSRVLDLGSLEEGAAPPPIKDERGFFGRLLESIGF